MEASTNVRTTKNKRNNKAIRIATIPGRQADGSVLYVAVMVVIVRLIRMYISLD